MSKVKADGATRTVRPGNGVLDHGVLPFGDSRASSVAPERPARKQIDDDVDDDAVDHRRARRDADEGQAGEAALADLEGDADDFVVSHAHRFGEFAENIAWSGSRAAEHIHVEMHVHCLRPIIGMAELPAESLGAELGSNLPHGEEMGALRAGNRRTISLLSSMPRSPISTRFRTAMFGCDLVHLVLPACASGNARVHGEAVVGAELPVGVEADDAHIAGCAFCDRLSDGVGTAG